MGPLPRRYRWLLAIGYAAAPRGHRDAWRREWRAELWHAVESGRRPVGLLMRTTSCLVDAVWLWRRELTMIGFTRDLRAAVRAHARAPAMTLVMILTLGIGLGATATIFTVVDRVILADLPLPDPDRLIRPSLAAPEQGIDEWPFSYAQYRVLTERLQAARMAVVMASPFNLVTDEGPVRITAARVSDTWFTVTGVQPALGRAFTREEEAGEARVAVVSHEFSERHLSGPRAALGAVLTLAGDPYQIIGVLPPGDRLAQQVVALTGAPNQPVDAFIPLEEFGSNQGDLVSTLSMVGRLTPGSSLTDARREVGALMSEFLEARGRRGWESRVDGLRERLTGPVRVPLLVMLGAAAMLLIMVATNLSGLVLVRGLGRSSEWAARRALGASPFRIARQLLTEGGLLAVASGVLALALAWAAVRALRSASLTGLPRAHELAVDPSTFAFAAVLVFGATVLFGLAPGLSAARRSPAEALTSTRHTMSAGGRRALRGLVAVELALAVVLLVASGVLVRSLGNLLQQDPGYSYEGVLQAHTVLERDRYPTDLEVTAFTSAIVERLRALPGVVAASVAMSGPPIEGPRKLFQKDGIPGEEHQGAAYENAVTSAYFQVMDIALLEGRLFTDADDATAPPVSIVTRTLAESLWPGESAVGKTLSAGSWRRFMETARSTPLQLRTVVGVVEDLTDVGPTPGAPVQVLFSPMAQDPWMNQTLLIRVAGAPAALTAQVRRALVDIDPDQPVFGIEPATVEVREAIGTEQLSARLLGGFAFAALLMSILGIYGVVTYSVALRGREIGIRMAVGADSGSVTRMFLRDGLRPIAAGLVLGFAGAALTVRVLEGMLYEIDPLDPVAFAAAGVVLAVCAFASTLIPALRTSRIDPVGVLRPE